MKARDLAKKWWWLALPLAMFGLLVYAFVSYNLERRKSPFRYFSWSEFDSPDLPGSGKLFMNENFVHKADRARECSGFPWFVTSGYRTLQHNSEVGGVGASSHMDGYAMDIAAPTDAMRRKIAKCAIQQGITRIGYGSTFIHLDGDPNKPQNIVWGYGNSYPTFDQLV